MADQSYRTFAKTADLYCLFYERALQCLSPEGVLAFISSNKFFRAGYGRNLRELLAQGNDLLEIIDFGELPVFQAGTDPCIVLALNQTPRPDKIRVAVIKQVEQMKDIFQTVHQIGFELDQTTLHPDGWALEHPESINLLAKIRAAGKPLGKYVNHRFYRGVLTGFNEAFVIDQTTRDRLIAEDSKSAEIIKPWLRGQDIRRWHADYKDLYVINIQSSSNRQWPWSGKTLDEAEKEFARVYPPIAKHLKCYREKLLARDDQGQYYWELRSCIYNDDFYTRKFIYPDIAKLMRGFLDNDCYFSGNTTYFIPNATPLIAACLNSRIFDWYARHTFQALGDPWNGGRLRFFSQYMGNVPIPDTTPEQEQSIEEAIDRIKRIKAADPAAAVTHLETQIDQLVYQLYHLTEQEIEIVQHQSE